MTRFVPVEDVDIWQLVEFLEGEWTKTSLAENGMWNFDMDYAKKFFENMFVTTPAPHGLVAIQHGVVAGVLIGVLSPTWAECRHLAFHTLLYRADNGCGLSLLKEVENMLPKDTRFLLSIQMKTAEKFERIADRLGFVECDRVFAKKIE